MILISRVDFAVLKSKEVQDLLDLYEERFGENFTPFSYADFHRVGDKCAAEMFKEALKEALNNK